MNVAAQIRQSLEHQSTPLWWPGLAEVLVAERRVDLPFDLALYSTSRFLRDIDPVRDLIVRSLIESDSLVLRLESVHPSIASHFDNRGLNFIASSEINADTVQTVSSAISKISLLPSLAQTVGELARSVHLLKVSDPGYDVSFSDPTIPFSIFVSIPTGPTAALRLAEAIIHESMHLQLSLIEEKISLVRNDSAKLYSPWKKERRPLSGIIHALYVFRVIDEWLCGIAMQESLQEYIVRRRAQIAAEILQIELGDEIDNLATDGRKLLMRLRPF